MSAYATLADLQAGWRRLDENELEIAQTLLCRASAIIRAAGGDRCDAMICKIVACDMVRYSMITAQNTVSSYYGETPDAMTWELPAIGGGLRLTEEHRRMLGLNDQVYYSVAPYGCGNRQD